MQEIAPRRRLFRRRQVVEARALTRDSLPDVMLPNSASEMPITERTAMTVSDVFACIKVLAETCASLPLHTYREADTGRERVDDGTAALLDRPAVGVTQFSFVSQIVTSLALRGEAFISKHRDENGDIFSLGLQHPDRVSMRLIGGLPFYGVALESGDFAEVGPSEIVHVKGMSLDGLRGMSPVAQMRDPLGHAQALARHGQRVIANNATPSGLLTVEPGPNADEMMGNLRASWSANHRGPDNAGRVAFLSADVKWQSVSMPLADIEFIAQREFGLREVARIWRIPMSMLNGTSGDSLTYSTVEQELRRFVVLTIRPILLQIEQALAADDELFPPAMRTYPLFELDALLRGDPTARASVYTAALNADTGWMTRAEVRDLEDLPAEETLPHAA